ncbi:hypothetical protein, partial [uncultured Cobetia sp.]|uniref:hypothetical protein n=1 Tax=uncultured Cobetia sp. TaxID=410706 RepID=UPI002591F1CF
SATTMSVNTTQYLVRLPSSLSPESPRDSSSQRQRLALLPTSHHHQEQDRFYFKDFLFGNPQFPRFIRQ